MKKKLLLLTMLPLLCMSCANHEHKFSEDFKFDETYHWHECKCGDKVDIVEHELVAIESSEVQEGMMRMACECGYFVDVEAPHKNEVTRSALREAFNSLFVEKFVISKDLSSPGSDDAEIETKYNADLKRYVHAVGWNTSIQNADDYIDNYVVSSFATKDISENGEYIYIDESINIYNEGKYRSKKLNVEGIIFEIAFNFEEKYNNLKLVFQTYAKNDYTLIDDVAK